MQMQPHTHEPRETAECGLRYGCLECQADAEAVMSGRIHPDVHARYDQHLRECSECSRAHKVLAALYRGPALPPQPGAHQRTREFANILRRIPDERPTPWYQQLMLTTGVGALAVASVLLLLNIVSPDFNAAIITAGVGVTASGDDDRRARGASAAGDNGDADPRAIRIEHRAQVDYGRIIGGQATLIGKGEQLVTTDTFEVGTQFRVAGSQSLQARFFGKILANFESDSDVRWSVAEPDMIEFELDRGMLAMRYDRQHHDPILKIHTPSAVVRVVGTVFTVEVDAGGDTVVSVLRGKVEVREPEHERLVAEVEAGYRFDVASSTYADVGHGEVAAALPLSEPARSPDELALLATAGPSGDRIPDSWVVPGLPPEPSLRTLDNLIVPRRAYRRPRATSTPLSDEELFNTLIAPLAPGDDDDGEALIEALRRDLERARRKELRGKLRRCQNLYQSAHTRYMAARCITEFMNRHGNERAVVEGWLLYGILRMDYANDYQVATTAFRKFLSRAPNHPDAELAMYRLWLAATELGRIGDAEARGREYLRRHPNGKYAGKILQRFPALIIEL